MPCINAARGSSSKTLTAIAYIAPKDKKKIATTEAMASPKSAAMALLLLLPLILLSATVSARHHLPNPSESFRVIYSPEPINSDDFSVFRKVPKGPNPSPNNPPPALAPSRV